MGKGTREEKRGRGKSSGKKGNKEREKPKEE